MSAFRMKIVREVYPDLRWKVRVLRGKGDVRRMWRAVLFDLNDNEVHSLLIVRDSASEVFEILDELRYGVGLDYRFARRELRAAVARYRNARGW